MMSEGYNIDIINSISAILQKRQETLAVAESVTAGQLQVAFSLADGATQIFQGGITTYNIGQKARHLKIDPIHAGNCNCVSQKVADQMASEVLRMFAADWGIAITGYASAVPEQNVYELFAHYAIYHHGNCVSCSRIAAPQGNVNEIRNYFTNTVLREFLAACKQIHM